MRVLHAGCGRDHLPEWSGFHLGKETRLDIDPNVNPDVVASMTALGEIGEFEAVWCCHALEHLFPDDGLQALKEFRRVLVKNGHAIIIVPDLQGIEPTTDVLYQSPAGPITGRDMIYGFRPEANPFMTHKTGYVQHTLEALMREAGYSMVNVMRVPDYNLLGIGVK